VQGLKAYLADLAECLESIFLIAAAAAAAAVGRHCVHWRQVCGSAELHGPPYQYGRNQTFLLLLLLLLLLRTVLQADIASTGDKYAAVQGLKAYLADLAECLEFKAPLVEEMQDSLHSAREEAAAALRQQEQVGWMAPHHHLYGFIWV
jgi:hypothetical protein